MNNSVTINRKKYKVKNTLRSMFIFEAITKKPFTLSTLMDAVEKNPSIITEMSKIIEHQGEVKSVIADDEEGDGNEKKN